MKLLFIGAGKMATALATAVVNNRILPVEDVTAVDVFAPAREAFERATGIRCIPDGAEAFTQSDIILLAVKPQVAESPVAALPRLRPEQLVISICAGIPIAKLAGWFGSERIIRVMPNTPLMVGCGASAYALGTKATAEDGAFAARLLGAAGTANQVDESLLDAVTGLSGSGPAYVFELAKALALAGEAVGLESEMSLALSIQTIAGAAEMLRRRIGSPDQLRDAVTSPNGTTAAGLAVMAAANFRQVMRDTVVAARDRSIELGKGK